MQVHTFFKRTVLSAAVLPLFGTISIGVMPQKAYAQMQDIVVTARKREENLLEVPFAISAFSEQDLQTSDLKDFTDLSLFTPGMTFQNATSNRGDRGVPAIIIRGLNTGTPTSSSDPALLFVDGAPVFGAEVGSFVDIERVEVLRGPQTAYFGRNTFSGAVNLVTKDPGEETGGFVGVEYGSYDTFDLQGSFESPIIEDVLAFRVSGRRNEKGGQYTNNFNGSREIGEELTSSIVGTLLWNVTENIKFKMRGNYTEIEDGPSMGFRFGAANANCAPTGGADNYRCGEPPDVDVAKAQIGWQNAFDPNYFPGINYPTDVIQQFSLYSNQDPNRTTVEGDGIIIDQMGLAKRIHGANFQVSVDLPADITLDWISSYSEISSQIVSDENTLPRNPFAVPADVFLVERYDENSSHEFRLASGSEQRLRWVGGASYIDNESVGSCVAGITGNPPAAAPFNCRPVQTVETLGIFGGLYYDLTDQWTISGELRWQNDEISVPGTVRDFQEEFNDVGGRFTLEYSPSDNVNLFANYSRGFRPGGFNTQLANLTPAQVAQIEQRSGAGDSYDPETLDQIEFGVKGSVLDNRLTGSAVVYWGEITDQQFTDITQYTNVGGDPNDPNDQQTINIVQNLGETELSGVELEGAWQATDEFLLQASFAWNKVEVKEGVNLNLVQRGIISDPRDIVGNQYNWVPEMTASAAANYSRPIFGVNGFARLEWLYEDTKYATLANIYETGDRQLVNLRLGVDQEVYRVELYVSNMFDNDTYYFVQNQFDLDTFGNAFLAGLPDRRAVGIRAFLNF
jgi:iron complex outermembrane receptor protein